VIQSVIYLKHKLQGRIVTQDETAGRIELPLDAGVGRAALGHLTFLA